MHCDWEEAKAGAEREADETQSFLLFLHLFRVSYHVQKIKEYVFNMLCQHCMLNNGWATQGKGSRRHVMRSTPIEQ